MEIHYQSIISAMLLDYRSKSLLESFNGTSFRARYTRSYFEVVVGAKPPLDLPMDKGTKDIRDFYKLAQEIWPALEYKWLSAALIRFRDIKGAQAKLELEIDLYRLNGTPYLDCTLKYWAGKSPSLHRDKFVKHLIV